MPFVQSGLFVMPASVITSGTVRTLSYTAVTGSSARIGTSATQFPASVGSEHHLKLLQSGTVFLGGASTIKSGFGLVLTRDDSQVSVPATKLDLSNLNLLYGIAVDSAVVTYLTLS